MKFSSKTIRQAWVLAKSMAISNGKTSKQNFADAMRAIIAMNAKAQNKRALLLSVTTPKMNKKNNPYHNMGITCIKTSIVLINPSYTDNVNEQRILEGKSADFIAQAPVWGTHQQGAIHSHNEQEYMSYQPIKTISIEYRTRNGDTINHSELEPFFPKSKSNSQGLETTIHYRKIKLNNIKNLELL